MLNMDEINKEIEKLEKCSCVSQDICNKLAILYIIKEHCNNSSSQKDNGISMTNPMSIK